MRAQFKGQYHKVEHVMVWFETHWHKEDTYKVWEAYAEQLNCYMKGKVYFAMDKHKKTSNVIVKVK